MAAVFTVLSFAAQTHLVQPTLQIGVSNYLSPGTEIALGLAPAATVVLSPEGVAASAHLPAQATPPPAPTPLPAPEVFELDSTSYCSAGTMADGAQTHIGAVANNMWPLGTRLEILTGEDAGAVVTVEDRIGYGSQLDVFNPSCQWSIDYGRELVQVIALAA